jgi:exonuclease SbcC
LEEVHLACLCGANGSGKSAILDSITWALWGRARGQRQEQLIHQGQQEMSVELIFDVTDRRYQIVRRHSRARKQGQSSLELSVFAGSEYRPITGNTISQTQEQIQNLINMDYETFVNSAFLVQGRADIFSMATPTQRKDVLAKVLGLGIYERLEERAKVRARNAQTRLDTLIPLVDQTKVEVDRKGEIKALVEQTESELRIIHESTIAMDERLTSLRHRIAQLGILEQEVASLDDQVMNVKLRLSHAKSERAGIEARIFSWEPTIGQSEEIRSSFQAYVMARNSLNALNNAGQELLALERELFPVEQRITASRVALEGKIGGYEERLANELIPVSDSLSECLEHMNTLTNEMTELAKRIETNQLAVDRQQEFIREANQLEAQNVILATDGADTRRKMDLLDHDHLGGSKCPLCGVEIGEKGRDRIQLAYREQIDEQRNRWAEQNERLKTLNSEASVSATKSKLEGESILGKKSLLERRRADLISRIDRAEKGTIERTEIQRLLMESRTVLRDRHFAIQEQTEAALVRTRIEDLGFDFSQLEVAKQNVEALQHWEDKHIFLEEIFRRLPDDKAAVTSAELRENEAIEELERLEQRRIVLQAGTNELPAYRAQLGDLEQQTIGIAANRDSLQSKMGSFTHQAEEILAAETELKRLKGASSLLTRDISIYEELAVAFGKSGIQSLLVEAAVPLLEDEANDLLKRMTDGRMSLKIETQRDRKASRSNSGEVIETLEITVGDDLGTRSYEMFSGGERFRIDFALRIALSKLLAWRSGAPLPTLFIDEGFGTQDIQGRDRILEVLKAIEDKFQRILVITHLDEVNEAFPVRIEVTRTESGSTFSLS